MVINQGLCIQFAVKPSHRRVSMSWRCVCTISGSTVHLPAAWKQANRAIRAARAAGHVVLIVNTWRVRCGDKTALNDILRTSRLLRPLPFEFTTLNNPLPAADPDARLLALTGGSGDRLAWGLWLMTRLRLPFEAKEILPASLRV